MTIKLTQSGNINFIQTGVSTIANSVADLRITNNSTLGNTFMTITTSGNVGIGTTSPTTALHVIGNGIISNLTIGNINITNSTNSMSFNNGVISNIYDVTTTYVTIGNSYRNPATGEKTVYLLDNDIARTVDFPIPGFSLNSDTSIYTYNRSNKLPLNSNSESGYTISASSSLEPNYNAPYKAFDMNNDTNWASEQLYSGGAHIGSSTTSDINETIYPGEWLQIQLPEAIILTNYRLGLYNLFNNFVILGGNDGTSWNLLDTRSNASGDNIYNIENNSSYSYYRIVGTNLQADYLGIPTWDLNYNNVSLIEDTTTQIRYTGNIPFADMYGTPAPVEYPINIYLKYIPVGTGITEDIFSDTIQPSETRPYAFDTGFIQKTFNVGDQMYFVVDYGENPNPPGMMPGMSGFPPSINVAISIKRMDGITTPVLINTAVPVITFNEDNIGIGTTSPQNKLEVVGNSLFNGSVTAGSLNVTGSSNLQGGITSNNVNLTGSLRVGGSVTAGSLNVTGSSNLQGGITTGSLRVAGNVQITNGSLLMSGTSATWQYPIQAFAGNLNDAGISLKIGKSNTTRNLAEFYYKHVSDGSTSNYASIGISGEHLNINGAGNVGIGTSAPAARLVIRSTENGDNTIWQKNSTTLATMNGGANSGDGGWGGGPSIFYVAKDVSTNRSINAAGTINVSGEDYAEYMTKSGNFEIAKGDIVGINSEGKLTKTFSEAISFVVKSTDPCMVGGDTWSQEIGLKPNEPSTDATEQEIETYNAELLEWETLLESERQKVDRIAFCGQIPVNLYGATPGDHIIPIQNEDGSISAQAVADSIITFEQFRKSVGKVINILEDGRALAIV